MHKLAHSPQCIAPVDASAAIGRIAAEGLPRTSRLHTNMANMAAQYRTVRKARSCVGFAEKPQRQTCQ